MNLFVNLMLLICSPFVMLPYAFFVMFKMRKDPHFIDNRYRQGTIL